jgi:hypothetical protein
LAVRMYSAGHSLRHRPDRRDIRTLDAGDRPAGPASSFAVGLGQGRSHPCLSRLWAKKEKYSCGGDFFL